MVLMQQMVAAGEADALVAERVWQELAKGLMENRPAQMLEILRECGALQVILPEVAALFGVPQRADYHPEIDTGIHTLMVLQQAADMGLTLPERYAALLHDLGKALTPVDILPKHHGHDVAGGTGAASECTLAGAARLRRAGRVGVPLAYYFPQRGHAQTGHRIG